MIDLATAMEKIQQAYFEAIRQETKEGGMLEGVRDIVLGNKARPQPEVPNVWVFREEATQDHTPTTRMEKWEVPIFLVSCVKDEIPEDGYKYADALAARSRSVILKDRTLGLRDFVQDTKTIRFFPSGPALSDGKMHSAAVVMQTTFLLKEGF